MWLSVLGMVTLNAHAPGVIKTTGCYRKIQRVSLEHSSSGNAWSLEDGLA